ncbi:MAG: hypothetical protein ABJ275_11695 [Maricaulaceae bacterium]
MSDTPTPNYTHEHILMPLAMTVIIDNKIRDPEMAEFYAQAVELFELFNLTPLSQDKVINWFKDNESNIAKKLAGPRKNTAILIALSRFNEDIHVENIYEAMIAISVCDKEYKREESDLVKSAASIWGYDRPPIKVID